MTDSVVSLSGRAGVSLNSVRKIGMAETWVQVTINTTTVFEIRLRRLPMILRHMRVAIFELARITHKH